VSLKRKFDDATWEVQNSRKRLAMANVYRCLELHMLYGVQASKDITDEDTQYNMACIKLQTPGNKDLTMKVPHVNGVSSVGIIPFSVINLLNANYVWVVSIVKTNVTTHTNTARLPSHVEFAQTIPDSIMLVIHKVSSIITPSS
jgi:hypothetical protein